MNDGRREDKKTERDTIAKIAARRKFVRRSLIALTNNNKQLSLRKYI